jgi:benzylsuccinate CoA-transferase BbsF subunit
MDYVMKKRVYGPRGDHHYLCKGDDKGVSIAVKTEEEWSSFCKAIGNSQWTKDPRFADKYKRPQNTDESERKTFVHIDHPIVGAEVIYGLPRKLSGVSPRPARHAPLLGEHNEYVFREILGLSEGEIAQLTDEKIIY